MTNAAERNEDRARILIVDDDERNLLALQTVLEDVADVVIARSGEEALRQLLRGEFAVILLDVFMPHMDGYETAQVIRQRDQTRRIPIIFLSAVNKEAEHLIRGYSMGAVDYVFKPVEPVVLKSKVAVFVDLYRMRGEIQRKAAAEQQLLDANLRANAELLRAEQELRAKEQELLQARKMDAIGKLTGGIAHDFNNLLAAILGGLRLIERRVPLDEAQSKIVTMTQHAAEQGAELVARLLSFARKQKLEPAAIAADDLAASVRDLLAHTLGGMVELQWSAAKGVWPVFADQTQLELALMNLIINARDAMPQGGTIAVTARNDRLTHDPGGAAAGDYVVLQVADQGSGIAPELIERVMEPFFTTKPVGKGTGLGLSMVYGFAQQSGGAMRIDSRVGEGTAVEIWLPRARTAAKARDGAGRALAAMASGSFSILLVDDHEGVRATTAAMLSDAGHAVTTAGDGREALDLLDGELAIDLLLTDYAMPQISGSELVRRARGGRPDLAAIMITGNADAVDASQLGFEILTLPKPFTPDQLDQAIRQAVHRPAPAGTA